MLLLLLPWLLGGVAGFPPGDCAQEDHQHYPGDYLLGGSYGPPASSEEECQAACGEVGLSCSSSTYYPGYGGESCWHYLLPSHPSTSSRACQWACQHLTSCQGYNFYPEAGRCELQAYRYPAYVEPGARVVTGPRSCSSSPASPCKLGEWRSTSCPGCRVRVVARGATGGGVCPWATSPLRAACDPVETPSTCHLATLHPPGGQECCRNTSCPAHVDVAMFTAGVGGHLPCSSSLFLLTSNLLPHTHRYSSTEGDAVLTYDTASDTIFGNIRIGDHRYNLDYVGSSYVWEEEDDRYEDEGDDDPPPPAPAADNTTMAEVSCLIYVTKEFINETKDITGFVRNMTDVTNQGYGNSELPITLSVHCIKEVTIPEVRDRQDMLADFMAMEGGEPARILNGADMAVLLVSSTKFNRCGVAEVHGVATNSTFAVVRSDCATKHLAFGHEVAHTFGAAHDYGKHTYSYGRGRLWKGFRTIMAKGYGRVRINYYSNPEVRQNQTGPFTGERERNNAAGCRLYNSLNITSLLIMMPTKK